MRWTGLRRIISRFIKNQKGVAMVEFALVVLPLLFLVMGIIEFGWLLNGQISLTSAAREGARAAVVNEDWEKAIARHVSSTALVVIDTDDQEGSHGQEKWIIITVNGRIDPIVGFFVKDAVYLSAEATMRKE